MAKVRPFGLVTVSALLQCRLLWALFWSSRASIYNSIALFQTQQYHICMQVVHNRNQHHVYTIGEHNIEEAVEERDLGVLVTETLSPSHHIAKIVRKANQIVGMIRRTYEDRSKNNLVPLYKSLVRPHLEYRVQAWRPYLQQYIQHRRSTAKDDQDDERGGRGGV